MKKVIVILFLVNATLFSCKQEKKDVPAEELKQAVLVISEKVIAEDFKAKTENQDVTLIDVRTPDEYNDGHLDNAQNIDFYDDNFLTDMQKLNKEEPLYIYCRSGGRSGKAAKQLKDLGFTEVYDLKGGFIDWQKNEFPSTKE